MSSRGRWIFVAAIAILLVLGGWRDCQQSAKRKQDAQAAFDQEVKKATDYVIHHQLPDEGKK